MTGSGVSQAMAFRMAFPLVKTRQRSHTSIRFSIPRRVVPAQAGTQASFHGGLTVTLPWPLFVEDSSIPRGGEFLDSRLRGSDGVRCDGLCIE